MPEIGLGIGCERGNYSGVTREWLYWYDELGTRYPAPKEQIEQETLRTRQEAQRADVAEQKAQQMAEKLRELGIDPDSLS